MDKGSETEEFEVEFVRATRVVRGEREYLLRWKGYGEEGDTWEREKELTHCGEAIRAFWERKHKGDSTAPVRRIHILDTQLRQGEIVYVVAFSDDVKSIASHGYLKKHYPLELLDYITNS